MLAGPVHYRWMYPVERSLGHLKSYVRNKAAPEANCGLVDPFREKFKTEVTRMYRGKRNSTRVVEEYVHQHFHEWFKEYVARKDDFMDITSEIERTTLRPSFGSSMWRHAWMLSDNFFSRFVELKVAFSVIDKPTRIKGINFVSSSSCFRGGLFQMCSTFLNEDNHLLQLMTTQVVVDEVWYLELQNLKLGETPLSLRKGK
ncbi:hypothetical protein P8452_35946 [Trifolium repens]|nr:hypothetical protein P8452_35946 [Trifolium repens]